MISLRLSEDLLIARADVAAAGPVRPFGGDHRQRDMRPRVVRVLGHRGGERCCRSQ